MTDALGRLASALEGRYRIERELGQGGMATVYLAEDVKHRRQVAVKVLNPELAASLGPVRFQREIEIAARLHHPHILPLHDSGEADGFLYYVMPLAEGESLRDRLNREKQLPIDDALEIAQEVADALSYAHSHDVVHRDIKPENILLESGHAVVADFGIARAITAAGAQTLTGTGMAIGTPAYMSPEQAAGEKDLDGRADLYSLGCVLYEMLAGQAPFTGPTTESIVRQHLAVPAPNITGIRPAVPASVAAALQRALAKVPADRFTTTSQFAVALTTTGSIPLSSTVASWVTARGSRRRVAGWAAVLGLAAVAGVAGWRYLRPRAERPVQPVARYSLRLPSDAPLAMASGSTIAVSPDGSRIVFVGRAGSEAQHLAGSNTQTLYARGLDQLDPVPIPGSQGGSAPFFSPDGRWLGFLQEGKLVRLALADGRVLSICDAPGFGGATWAPGDTIIFGSRGSLAEVPATGGAPRIVATPDSARRERFESPEVLPDGRAVLFSAISRDGPRLAVLVRRTGELKRLEETGSQPRFVAGGFVLFAYTSGLVTAVPFDARQLRTTGPAIPVAEDVDVGPGGAAKMGVSSTGDMVYSRGTTGLIRLVLVDRDGVTRDLGADTAWYWNPRVSPEGRRVAFAVHSSKLPSATRDLWVYDIAQRTRTRLTFDSAGTYAHQAVWSPDGRRIAFTRMRGFSTDSAADLYWLQADGAGAAEPLVTPGSGRWFATGFGPDGKTLLFEGYPTGTQTVQLWHVRLDRPGAQPQRLVTEGDSRSSSLSPDGRWVAYVSNASGRAEVYVTPFPGPGGRRQVSTDGGTESAWSPAGGVIYYRLGPRFMAATVRTRPDFEVLQRVQLFAGRFVAGGARSYDVTPDGRQFVMLQTLEQEQELIVVLNWFDQLSRQR